MKRYIKNFAVFAAAALSALSACGKFDEMSKNPYALYDVPSESLVQPILYNAEYKILQRCYDLIPEMMQYTVNMGFETSATLIYDYDITENISSSLWNLYEEFGNAQYMLKLAREEDNPAMEGVALILRTWLMSVITDTYGNVPYFNAGLISQQGEGFSYRTTYDPQEEIYRDMFISLETANRRFIEAEEAVTGGLIDGDDFSRQCDYMYSGDVGKWRKFGNSLYLRLLVRSAMKIEEETGGNFMLNDELGEINVPGRISEIYDSFTGNGQYPVFGETADAARVGFSYSNSALFTPFYSTTSGVWNAEAACRTLVKTMMGDDFEDPRYYYYFHKYSNAKKDFSANPTLVALGVDDCAGAPTQLSRSDMSFFFNVAVSQSGNSSIGRYPRKSQSSWHTGDLKNADSYAIMNYSEVLFCFAEAAARGWLTMSGQKIKELYLDAVRASVLEWNKTLVPTSAELVDFISHLDGSYDPNNALEHIMTQKWVSTFWCGTEAWCDYRRTGYPLLKTNGEAAENDCVLPTRMRYPATEDFYNAEQYALALNGWLGGTNNMTTDLWWASTAESRSNRAKGRN